MMNLPTPRVGAPFCACGCGHRTSTRAYVYIAGHRPKIEVPCRVEGCGKAAKYRGKRLCQTHYGRLRLNGSLELPQRPDDRARLLTETVRTQDGCWLWTGSITAQGYGRLGNRFAHRAAFEIFVGEIPQGYQIDHTCHGDECPVSGPSCLHRRCCNPRHLEAVTSRVNFRRSNHPGAVALRNSHDCPDCGAWHRVGVDRKTRAVGGKP